jgi:hypothetical protein
MSRRPISLLAALASAALVLTARPARAATPVEVPVQGLLADAQNGKPVDGAVSMIFSLHEPGASAALFSETLTVNVDGGLFTVYLGQADAPLDAELLRDHPSLELAVSVEGDALGRFALGAAPFAGYALLAGTANDAAKLGGKSPAELLADIGGGTVTSVETGAGLTGGPITASGTVSVAPGGITGALIADDAVGAQHLDVKWALGVTEGGDAAGLTCMACVDDAEVSFNYAASASKGGPASDLACSGCVAATEVSFNYAASASQGGPASDLACTSCVAEGELAFDPATQVELDAHKTSNDHAAEYVNAAGDTMTGTLSLPANGLVCGATQLVLSGGNVGVGTADPLSSLHVESGASNFGGGWFTGSADQVGVRLGNLAAGGRYWHISSTAGTSNAGQGALGIGSTPTATVDGVFNLVITNSGRVGVGTVDPQDELHVVDTSGSNFAARIEQLGATGQGLFLRTAADTQPALIINDAANSVNRHQFFGNGNVFLASGGGSVGIGTTAPSSVRLQVEGSEGVRIRTTGNTFGTNSLDIENSAAADLFNVRGNGDVIGIYGSYHVASDRRLKTGIVTIPNALDKVLALRGVNFYWKDSQPGRDDLQMGMIAQEVEQVVPEVVHTADDEKRTKAVEYEFLVGLLVEAIKDQQARIETQAEELASLRKKVASLEARDAHVDQEIAALKVAMAGLAPRRR